MLVFYSLGECYVCHAIVVNLEMAKWNFGARRVAE